MNNFVKVSIGFVVGACAGAFTAYKLLEKKFAAIAQEEIDSVIQQFSTRHYTPGVPAKDPVTEMTDEQYEKQAGEVVRKYVPANDNEAKKSQIFRRGDRQYVPYNEIPLKDEHKPDVRVTATIERPEERQEQEFIEEPHVIDREEFDTEYNGAHEKLTLYYYEEDDTLIDEKAEPVADTTSLVGEEALMCFGEDSDDPDTVYVRNSRICCDFEIVRLHKSYKEDVLGMMPEKKIKVKTRPSASQHFEEESTD